MSFWATRSAFATTSSGRGDTTKSVMVEMDGGWSVISRPSAIHFVIPPSSTSQSSKPLAFKTNQTRAAIAPEASSYATTFTPWVIP